MAAKSKQQLDLATFTRWIDQISQQPAWRGRADREAEYYDGNQLDSEVLQRQRELGIPPAIEPIIKPTIDSVLGLEVKQRTDWKVVPDSDKLGDDDVADALNFKLGQAEKKSRADAACSEGFRGQATVGIGWVEVSRCQDPFKFPYRCTPVHRNEIFWDFLSKEPDLSDARYLVRRKWVDVELAKLMFPKKADLITSSGNGWKGIDFNTFTPDGGSSTDLAMSYDLERGWSVEEQEWRDLDNSRVCLFEVWYRHWERVKIIRPPDGRVVEFESTNPAHIMAVAVGGMQVEEAVVGKVRLAWYCGPHSLSDQPSPYQHRLFPYVPFWGFREDRTAVPYGMVRGMVFLQDEINARISKMQWLLSARSVVRTDGIVMDEDETFRQMVGRPDSDVVLDPAAASMPGARYEVERNFELNRQQYERLQDAREGIKRVSGVAPNFEGQAVAGQSGIAASTLIEQSVQAITDLMDNFRAARTMVGELLLSMIIQDTDKREEVTVPGGVVSDKRVVVLNDPAQDEETGVEYLNNDVQRTMLKVALEDVPSTPTFRAQQLASMSEAFKAMPQIYQQATMPFLFSLMDVPNKKEILEIIKGLSTVPDEETIKKRIDDAVVAKGLELKARELDGKDRLNEAQIQKIVAEAVAKTIESIYSATQAGMQISQVPGIAPIADQLLRSAGFQDKDQAPIVAPGQIVVAPQGEAVPTVDPAQNTSPMFPPRANPEQVQQVQVPQGEEMGQADEGMNYGIEKEGVQ